MRWNETKQDEKRLKSAETKISNKAIQASVFSCDWNPFQLNLQDTPRPLPDFCLASYSKEGNVAKKEQQQNTNDREKKL